MARTFDDFKKWYLDQLASFDATSAKTPQERISFLWSLTPVYVPRNIEDAIVLTEEEMNADGARWALIWELSEKLRKQGNERAEH